MPKLFKGTHEILSLAGGTQNVKALYAGDKLVWGEGEDPLKDFIFLSYVNVFDNGKAKSIVGGDVPADTLPLYVRETPIGTMTVPYITNGKRFETGEVIEDLDVQSFELFYNTDSPGYLQANQIRVSGIILESNTSHISGKNLIVLFFSTNDHYEIKYNGLTFHEKQSTGRLCLSSNLAPEQWHHIAVVKSGTTRKLYVDGSLWLIVYNENLTDPKTQIRAYAYENLNLYVTQLAVRRGDLSINNGENYPVPTEPYAKL